MPKIIDHHPANQTEVSGWEWYTGYAGIFGIVFDDQEESANRHIYEHARVPLGEIFETLEPDLEIFDRQASSSSLTGEENDFLYILKSTEKHRQLKIVGDVGTGKTTFIKHLMLEHLTSKEFGGAHSILLDWRGFTASIKDPLPDIYQEFTQGVFNGFESIFDQVTLKEVDSEVFNTERLFAIDRQTLAYEDEDKKENAKYKMIAAKMQSDPVDFAFARLNVLCASNPNNIVLIFDNIDQLDSSVLEHLLQFFIEIQTKTNALTVIAMRDHTDTHTTEHFSQYKRTAVISAWRMKLFPPNIRNLLLRRLEYYFPKNEDKLPSVVQFGSAKAKLSRDENIRHCRTFIAGLTRSESTLDFLNRWSNYSVRTFFKVVQSILSFSGLAGREPDFYNDSFSISEDDCLIALCLDSHKLHYSHKSSIVNIYSQSKTYSDVAPIVATRVLQLAKVKGEMIVANFVNAFKEWGYDESLVNQAIRDMVNKDLFWSDTGDPTDLTDESKIKISHRGDLYLGSIIERTFYNYIMSFSTNAPTDHSLLRDYLSETNKEIETFYRLSSVADINAIIMRVMALSTLIHEAEIAERKLIRSRRITSEYKTIFGAEENLSARVLHGLLKLIAKVSTGSYKGRTLSDPSMQLMQNVNEKLIEYRKFEI